MNKILFALIGLVFVGGAAVFVWKNFSGDRLTTPTVNARMHGAGAAAAARGADKIVVPELSPDAKSGKVAFDKNCASCHGAKAAGTDKGPPLIHKIYEPSHHGDFSFLRAARNGVRSHHWRFGNMPPIDGVTEREVNLIVTYVRQMQRANGIN